MADTRGRRQDAQTIGLRLLWSLTPVRPHLEPTHAFGQNIGARCSNTRLEAGVLSGEFGKCSLKTPLIGEHTLQGANVSAIFAERHELALLHSATTGLSS
ncbi:hypothetical protein OH710_06760 [Pseudomonas capsici]|uniref:hypothetical protein n=1 Tax=Pseudomonas capsici TaxID=2810614 RepID=UPI0021F0BE2E|nr:hypothetical protein [Pseudomonas capsici]MCV4272339.1 hypothetical protein [Pseudomonas capsici]